MKILNILFNYKKSLHNNKILGVERCFLDYAKNFTANDCEVLSISQNQILYNNFFADNNLPFIEVAAKNRFDIKSLLIIIKNIIKFSPDVAICHSGKAMFFLRLARLLSLKKFAIIAIDHGIKPTKFLNADAVFTVNSYFNRMIIDAGKNPDSAFIVPNMIDLPDNFQFLNKSTFHRPIRLGSLGRLYPEKSFDMVIKAMKILKDQNIDTEYVIGGVGYQKEYLLDLAKYQGLADNFKILGWVDDKRKFFSDIDIFILPSAHETFGIVLLEAMLYNTPIITTNSFGPNDIINNDVDGIKIDIQGDKVNDYALDIANAIIKLNNNQDFAREIAYNGYQKFLNNYQSAKVVALIKSYLEKVKSQYFNK